MCHINARAGPGPGSRGRKMEPSYEEQLAEWEAQYPGLRQQLAALEAMPRHPCAYCGDTDTAMLIVGVTGRTMSLAALTDRVKLVAYREEPGERWCRICARPF